jgi:multidrug efflux pump subunit AcrB
MKNGIILIDFANDAILEGKNTLEAIQHACHARFAPSL